MTSRIVLLVTSPRLPAGLLSARAWDLVRAHPVLTAAEGDWTDALRAAGGTVRVLAPAAPAPPAPDQSTDVQPAPANPSTAAPGPTNPNTADPAVNPAGGPGRRPELPPPPTGPTGRHRPTGQPARTPAGPRAGGWSGGQSMSGPDPALIEYQAEALLTAVAAHGTVVWLAGPTGDPQLTRRLGRRIAQRPGLAELELVYGAWDPPGAQLLDAVAVIDRLVSPGGDPWKRAQTHATLAPYLLEEAYEAYDAIESGDLAAVREELGDVLLQVLLHARLAEEAPDDQRWSIDDLAAEFVVKMVRRNPHVFAGLAVTGMSDILDNWERIKREEKPRRSAMDGIVWHLPALSLAAKVLSRAERADLAVPVPPPAPAAVDATDPARLGEALLGIVAVAHAAGVDAEAALRRATLAHADQLRASEQR